MLVSTVLAVVVAIAGSASATTGICKLTLQSDLDSHNEPLVLEVNTIRNNKEQIEIVRPEVEIQDRKTLGVVHVAEDKKLLFACTGNKNVIPASGHQSAYATCSNGVLEVDGTPISEESLSCTHGVANSWVTDTKEECGQGDEKGSKFELGFMLTDEKPSTFLPMVDVCHNVDKMVTYYSAHQLYGASLRGAVKSSERRNFSPGPKSMGLFRGVDVSRAYSQAGQKAAFDKILGEGANEKYINKKVFLARGHLSPDADFIYNSGQLMTYYYINVAPQWQTFNAGNWLTTENAVRDLAAKEKATLSVFTGTFRVLKLTDLNGVEQEIHLNPKGEGSSIPVPEVYWKIVQHPVKKSCTVVVGHNNVFLTTAPTPICKTTKPDGWPTLDKLEKGYTYYCDYDSFKEIVVYAPKLECKDTFEFPTIHS